jgi:hypothetical protein
MGERSGDTTMFFSSLPTKPPDIRGDGSERQKISFRDKLMGANAVSQRREYVDLIEKQLFRIDLEEGDRLKPKGYLNEKVVTELCMTCTDAVIIKLLGKTIGYVTMKERLKGLWKLAGNFDRVDIGHGFFMVKFDLEADREKVLTGGPWMIFDHYLAVRSWVQDFISSEVKIDKTLVWIRIPCLGMEYYDESVLMALATAVGRPVRVDIKTVDA